MNQGSRLQRGSDITGSTPFTDCPRCRVWLLLRPSVDLDLRSHGGACPSRTLGRRARRSESNDSHTPPGLASLVYRATRPLRDVHRCRRRRSFTTLAGRDHHFFLIVFSKIALPSLTFSGVHSRRPRRVLLRYRRATAGPRSVLVGFHHLDGFLLQRGACVLQHAADLRVRPVWPLARFPPDAALPFEAFPPLAAARRHSCACARDSPTRPTLSAFLLPRLPPPSSLRRNRGGAA